MAGRYRITQSEFALADKNKRYTEPQVLHCWGGNNTKLLLDVSASKMSVQVKQITSLISNTPRKDESYFFFYCLAYQPRAKWGEYTLLTLH